ncbi:MAG: histidine kinase dimerization/phospho-acceptor domain-containing protein [Limnohabitans sp.]|uniref:histidine kinase dimerization/phospho-acceptor domain-containing protein n=1 Tax=Limnohabitans sp. TaxID=1907725 RepID=UPI003BB0DCE9
MRHTSQQGLSPALYSVVVSLFVFSPHFPLWVRGPLISGLSGLSVLLLLESLRSELSNTPSPWARYSFLALSWFLLIWLVFQFPRGESVGRALHLVLISGLEFYLVWVANRVRHLHQSRAIWILMFTISAFAFSNLSRVLEYLMRGEFSLLQDFTLPGRFALVMNYLSAIFYCYGYWGFVVEKSQNLMVKATEQAVLAREREKLAQVGKLAQSGALSASIAHEVNQPLAAIQLNAEEAQRMAREGEASEALLVLLSRIEQDNRRAAQVVQRIRAMFRQDSPKHEPMVLDELVLRMVNVNRARLDRERIDLRLVLDAPQPRWQGLDQPGRPNHRLG